MGTRREPTIVPNRKLASTASPLEMSFNPFEGQGPEDISEQEMAINAALLPPEDPGLGGYFRTSETREELIGFTRVGLNFGLLGYSKLTGEGVVSKEQLNIAGFEVDEDMSLSEATARQYLKEKEERKTAILSRISPDTTGVMLLPMVGSILSDPLGFLLFGALSKTLGATASGLRGSKILNRLGRLGQAADSIIGDTSLGALSVKEGLEGLIQSAAIEIPIQRIDSEFTGRQYTSEDALIDVMTNMTFGAAFPYVRRSASQLFDLRRNFKEFWDKIKSKRPTDGLDPADGASTELIVRSQISEGRMPNFDEARRFAFIRKMFREENISRTFEPVTAFKIGDKLYASYSSPEVDLNINTVNRYGNDMGVGIILTNDPTIAKLNASNPFDGSSGRVFEVNLKDANLFDLDSPMPEHIKAKLKKELGRLLNEDELDFLDNRSTRDIFKDIEAISAAEGSSLPQEMANQIFINEGYKGYKFVTDNAGVLHNTAMIFNPNDLNIVRSEDVTPLKRGMENNDPGVFEAEAIYKNQFDETTKFEYDEVFVEMREEGPLLIDETPEQSLVRIQKEIDGSMSELSEFQKELKELDKIYDGIGRKLEEIAGDVELEKLGDGVEDLLSELNVADKDLDKIAQQIAQFSDRGVLEAEMSTDRSPESFEKAVKQFSDCINKK